MPYLKLSAVHDDKAGTLTLFALNRSLDEAMPLELEAGGFGTLGGQAGPAALRFRSQGGQYQGQSRPDGAEAAGRRPLERPKRRGTLAPASWNVIRLETAK